MHFRGQLDLVRTLTRDARKGVWPCGGGMLAGALLDEIHVLLVNTHTESCDSGDYQRLPP